MGLPKGCDPARGQGRIRAFRRRAPGALAIARAIYKDAPILLLDEPTSRSTARPRPRSRERRLEELMRGRTVLMIAHRLSTVQKADLICVLDQGRIVEVGITRDWLPRAASLHRSARPSSASLPTLRKARTARPVTVRRRRRLEGASVGDADNEDTVAVIRSSASACFMAKRLFSLKVGGRFRQRDAAGCLHPHTIQRSPARSLEPTPTSPTSQEILAMWHGQFGMLPKIAKAGPAGRRRRHGGASTATPELITGT